MQLLAAARGSMRFLQLSIPKCAAAADDCAQLLLPRCSLPANRLHRLVAPAAVKRSYAAAFQPIAPAVTEEEKHQVGSSQMVGTFLIAACALA